ncbi:hypothetical protein [Bacillus bingmayongensis]|uniref:hypothetical protein n=1 Tax=Bacillus bingmayongensis TaxID=1150157 RepID=UPI0002FE12B0|nr:hypothetical protein [Bacillus bingmayongensis]
MLLFKALFQRKLPISIITIMVTSTTIMIAMMIVMMIAMMPTTTIIKISMSAYTSSKH